MAKAKTAQQLVQEILGPQIAASNQAYRNKGASANAAYAAAAEMQQGVAPAITDTYNAASAREAVMAKGLAVGQQLAEQETAGASNSLLAQNNSPQQVKASGAGDILATLGGLSASGLNREGAAFSSAAQWLPTQSRNLGIDAVKQAGLEGVAARGALEAQRPGLVSQARAQASEDARANRALNINEKYLNNSLRQAGATITGFDPATGLPTFASTATTTAATGKAKEKKQAAVAKRNDATAKAFIDMADWVEGQLEPGTALTPKGQQPIESHKVKRGKETITYYVKKGGGTTTNVKEAETKTVYDEQLIPKKQYDQLYKGLTNRLTQQLRRYGYKPKQVSAMADDILSDYFTVVGGQAANPTVPDKTGIPPNKR